MVLLDNVDLSSFALLLLLFFRSLLTKQKDYRDLSREILNLKCHEAKVEQQLSCLQEKLQGIDPDQLPLGIDLKDQQSLGPIPQTVSLHYNLNI